MFFQIWRSFWIFSINHLMLFQMCLSSFSLNLFCTYLMLFRIRLVVMIFLKNLYVLIRCSSIYVCYSNVFLELVPIHSVFFYMFWMYLHNHFDLHPMIFWMSSIYLWVRLTTWSNSFLDAFEFVSLLPNVVLDVHEFVSLSPNAFLDVFDIFLS